MLLPAIFSTTKRRGRGDQSAAPASAALTYVDHRDDTVRIVTTTSGGTFENIPSKATAALPDGDYLVIGFMRFVSGDFRTCATRLVYGPPGTDASTEEISRCVGIGTGGAELYGAQIITASGGTDVLKFQSSSTSSGIDVDNGKSYCIAILLTDLTENTDYFYHEQATPDTWTTKGTALSVDESNTFSLDATADDYICIFSQERAYDTTGEIWSMVPEIDGANAFDANVTTYSGMAQIGSNSFGSFPLTADCVLFAPVKNLSGSTTVRTQSQTVVTADETKYRRSRFILLKASSFAQLVAVNWAAGSNNGLALTASTAVSDVGANLEPSVTPDATGDFLFFFSIPWYVNSAEVAWSIEDVTDTVTLVDDYLTRSKGSYRQVVAPLFGVVNISATKVLKATAAMTSPTAQIDAGHGETAGANEAAETHAWVLALATASLAARTPTPSTGTVIHSGHSLTDTYAKGGIWPTAIHVWLNDTIGGGHDSTLYVDVETGPGSSMAWRRVNDDPHLGYQGVNNYEYLVVTDSNDTRPEALYPSPDAARDAKRDELALWHSNAETAGDSGAGAELIYYSCWPAHGDFAPEADWRARLVADEVEWRARVDYAHAQNPSARTITMVPGVPWMIRLWDDAEAGNIPGIVDGAAWLASSRWWSDTVHPNEVGRYACLMLHMAVLYQIDPRGTLYAGLYTTNNPTAAEAAYVQDVAWDIASTYDRAGIVPR